MKRCNETAGEVRSALDARLVTLSGAFPRGLRVIRDGAKFLRRHLSY